MDDLILVTPTVDHIHKIRDRITNQYDLKDLRELTDFLGMTIIHDKDSHRLFLSQHAYIQKMRHKYHFEYSHLIEAPSDGTDHLVANPNQASQVIHHYQIYDWIHFVPGCVDAS